MTGAEHAFRVICQCQDGRWVVRDMVAASATAAFHAAEVTGGEGAMIPGVVYPASVSPLDEDRIIKHWRTVGPMSTCLACGYQLTGLPRGEFGLVLCPECGLGMRELNAGPSLGRAPVKVSRSLFDPGRVMGSCGLAVGAAGLWLPEAAVGAIVLGAMAYEACRGRRGWVAIALGMIGVVYHILISVR